MSGLSRREFFKRTAGAVIAAAVVPHLSRGIRVSGNLDEQLLQTTGWATGEGLNVGDIFTIEGVHAINPLTFESTGFPQQFVVTATVTSSVNGVLSIPIWPAMRTIGPYQTVDALPRADATVVPFLCGESMFLDWNEAAS